MNIIEQLCVLEHGKSVERGAALTALLDQWALCGWYEHEWREYEFEKSLPSHLAMSLLSWRKWEMAPAHFVDAVAAHYEREDGKCVMSTPIVIVNELQHIASGVDDVATSARKLLTYIQCGWIANLGATELEFVPCPVVGFKGILRPTTNTARRDAATADAIARFVADPLQHQWFAFAVQQERGQLTSELRTLLAGTLKVCADTADPRSRAYIGTAILQDMSDEQATALVDLASKLELAWGPSVVAGIADSARDASRIIVWTRAVEQLLTWMEDKTLPDKLRVNTMMCAMQQMNRARRTELMVRIAIVANEHPFVNEHRLRAELRRRGLI
jgi:hypothetical protein